MHAEWFNFECRQKHKEKQKHIETHQTEKTEESWKDYIESKNTLDKLIKTKQNEPALMFFNSLALCTCKSCMCISLAINNAS